MSSIAAIMLDRNRWRIRSATTSALKVLSVMVVWRLNRHSHTKCCRESSSFSTQKGQVARCRDAGAFSEAAVASSVRPPSMSSRVAVR